MILLRRLVAAAVGLLLAVALWASNPAVARADDPDPVKPGSQNLAACLQGARTLSVLIVFDKSGSLTGTDPRGVRYDGMRTLLGQLARVNRTNEPLNVEVAVSAFSTTYSPARDVVDWTTVNGNPEHRQAVIDGIVAKARHGTAPERGSTNFQAALEGGMDDLRDRSGPETCRVLVWFTDGEFNDAPGGVDGARASMCQPSGLLDAIRRQRIVVIGLQLGTVQTDLRPMSLGKDGDSTCGTYPLGEADAPGIYLNAEDVGKLGRVFAQLTQIIQGCTDAGTSGLIDPGIRRMIVSTVTDAPVNTLRLQPPDAPAFDAPTQGGAQASGYTTHGSSDDTQVAVEVTFPRGQGAGQWATGSTQASEVHYCVFADLALKPLPNQQVPAQPKASMTFQTVDRQGDAAALSEYERVSAAASVVGPDAKPRVATASVTPEGLVTLTFDALPSDARMDYTVKVFLKTRSGLDLPPVTLAAGQALLLSEDYPIVTPRDELDLGRAVKRQPARADLTLVGSTKGPTEVCFEPARDVRVPNAARGTTVDFATGCVALATGETRTVTVSVTPAAIAVGDGTATIPVSLHPVPASASPPADFDLPTVWRFENPLNPVVAVVTTVLVALLAALVPLLALGLANWLTSRYEVRGLKSLVVPVSVEGSTIVPSGGEDGRGDVSAGLLSPTRLQNVPGLAGPVREFRAAPLVFRSKSRPTPTFVPRFWVEPPVGHSLVCSTRRAGDPDDGSTASVPPGLGLVVVLVAATAALRSEDATVPARLVVLSRDRGLTASQVEEAMASLDVDRLRRALRARPGSANPKHGPTGTTNPNPFGGPDDTGRPPRTGSPFQH